MSNNKQSPGKFSRRDLMRGGLAATAAGALLPLLTACPVAPAPGAAPASSEAAGPEEIEMLAFWWSDSPRDAKVLTDTFTAFEERHPGVKITFDDTSANHLEKLMTNMAAGTPPDIFAVHVAWMVQVANAGQLVDWTPYAEANPAANLDDYFPAQLGFYSYNGGLYALPYYSGPSCIWYNEDIFREKGLKTPWEHEQEGTWTWETLIDLARQTTGGEGMERTLGWDAAQNPHNIHYYLCVPWWTSGVEFINKDETEWQFDQEEIINVIQWHQDMALKDKSLVMPADLQGITRMFDTGRLAIAWGIKAHAVSIPGDNFTVGHAPTPKGPAGRINRDGPNGVGSATGSKYKDLAFEFGLFMGGEEGAPTYLASGRSFPVRQSLKDSKYFYDALRPFERAEVHLEAAQTVRNWRNPGQAAEWQRVFKAAIDEILLGQAQPAEALARITPEMNELLKLPNS
ncbi:MAG: sugar ABC transporter substrate-binding protein [Caldilineaceae bacterium]